RSGAGDDEQFAALMLAFEFVHPTRHPSGPPRPRQAARARSHSECCAARAVSAAANREGAAAALARARDEPAPDVAAVQPGAPDRARYPVDPVDVRAVDGDAAD